MMRFASVCSGLGGAELAFAGLAQHVFASETEAFPRAVLRHHFPGLHVYGDFRDIESPGSVDVLAGGTPCQSFSVAGLRRGMEDERGNLALEYLRLADRLRPAWVLWENVPGVLSSNDGRDFGAFVGGLAECGYGWAYRVLDAQHFGLAQRRKRVFVVGCLGDWRRTAEVLFEPASLRGDTPPRREARQGTAPTLASRATAGGGLGTDFDCDGGLIAHSVPARPHASHREDSDTQLWEEGPDGRSPQGLRLAQQLAKELGQALPQLPSPDPSQGRSLVRRLTPLEAERLQGFPDGWTAIDWRGKPAADGPRYRALGNAFAIPVVRWIARRIAREHAADEAVAA